MTKATATPPPMPPNPPVPLVFAPRGVGKEVWDEATIRAKLTNLANADKTKQWICKDLSTSDSGRVGRCLWKIAKHCQCLRSIFYNVDINATAHLLQRLKEKIPDGHAMADLFDKALGNFEKITFRRIELPGRVFAQVQKEARLDGASTLVVDNDPSCCTCYPVIDTRPWYARTLFYRPYYPRTYIHVPFRPTPVIVAPISRAPIFTRGIASSGLRQIPGGDRGSRSWFSGFSGSSYRSASSYRPSYRPSSSSSSFRPSFGGGATVFSRGIASSGFRVIPGSRR